MISLFSVTSDMIICPGFSCGDGNNAIAGEDFVLFEFWNQPLSSNASLHSPKYNGHDLASGWVSPFTIESGLSASNIPFSAVTVLKCLADASTSRLTINLGILLNGKPCTSPLIPSFTSIADLSTYST